MKPARLPALLVAAVFWAPCLTVSANAQPAPGPPRRVAEITLGAIPITVMYRGRPVRVRYPEDPGLRARGGSGGPIIEIVISPPDGTPPVVFEAQSIGLALVESSSNWPAFEIWSNAGGGIYTRAVYTWRPGERQYCSDRVDEFEDHGDEILTATAVTLIGLERFVRFARSRAFSCNQ